MEMEKTEIGEIGEHMDCVRAVRGAVQVRIWKVEKAREAAELQLAAATHEERLLNRWLLLTD